MEKIVEGVRKTSREKGRKLNRMKIRVEWKRALMLAKYKKYDRTILYLLNYEICGSMVIRLSLIP